jgi:serine/threonine-protein kinase
MSSCLDDNTLAGLVEGWLDPPTATSATAHVAECETCRALLVDVVRCVEPASLGRGGAAAGHALGGRATVGRYVILECIGSGAMGIVYTARDPDLGRKVALKLLRADAASKSSSEHRARLLREAQATARLSHPNVITIYDVGTVGEEVFLAMELVDGGTLRDWMSAPHSWREVLGVMRRAGEGLAAAHAAGLVHRDFKPDNVLVGRDGRVRVTDFGLARSDLEAQPSGSTLDPPPAELAASMTQTGAFVGTPAYMAPEQREGGIADARSDVFSFCVTFYEALHGTRPFHGQSLGELAAAIQGGVVQSGPRGGGAPAWLRRVIRRGLQPRPEDRPATIQAVLDALDDGASRARRSALVLGALALTGVAVFSVATLRGKNSGAAAAMPTRVPKPTSVVDLPMPPSENQEALRAYARGLQGMRDGSWDAREFEHAAELDPSLAAAHLRFAMLRFWQLPTQGREHLAKAVEGRSSLDEHDQSILRAAQAWMQTQPSDDAAFVRLIGEAQARYPMDAELAYYAGAAQSQVANHPEAIARLDRAVALDPGFAAAYQLKADEQAYSGDLDGALATIDTCVTQVPEATRCLMERALLYEASGDCDRLEDDSRRMQAHDPNFDFAYFTLALAAYVQGKPLETVREILQQEVSHAAPSEVHVMELKHAYRLAALSGDFDQARSRAEELRLAAGASPDRRARANPTLMEADALLEAGRAAEAATVIRQFLQREQAWAPEPRSDDFSVMRDSMPSFWIVERRAGILSSADFERQRGDWARSWESRLPVAYRPFAWLHGYARVAETQADAEQALSELPRFGPVPVFTPLTFGDAFVGKTYALARRYDEAIPYLKRAARSCVAVSLPFQHTEANFYLGQALAATGMRDEACDAYGVVLSRWGKARPKSITADRARAQSSALGCK